MTVSELLAGGITVDPASILYGTWAIKSYALGETDSTITVSDNDATIEFPDSGSANLLYTVNGTVLTDYSAGDLYNYEENTIGEQSTIEAYGNEYIECDE